MMNLGIIPKSATYKHINITQQSREYRDKYENITLYSANIEESKTAKYSMPTYNSVVNFIVVHQSIATNLGTHEICMPAAISGSKYTLDFDYVTSSDNPLEKANNQTVVVKCKPENKLYGTIIKYFNDTIPTAVVVKGNQISMQFMDGNNELNLDSIKSFRVEMECKVNGKWYIQAFGPWQV
tara:strand:- start:3034 stop:3579 length:546 start_codon:yes stop_codon:yes gene_type:complete